MKGTTTKRPSKKAAPKIGNTVPQIITKHVFTLFNAFNFIIAVCIILVGAYENLLYLGVILCNILIGIVQDIRSMRIVQKLSLITEPHVTVIRAGEYMKVPPDELKQGDLMQLMRGDQICADATVAGGSIEVNEALLTGESGAIKKSIGDTLLSGSFVSSGICTAYALRVGESSYAGDITNQAKQPKKSYSLLLDSLNKLVKFTSLFILPLGAILFYQSYALKGLPIKLAVTTTSAALLGLLPKGLLLLTSVSLALGVIRLGKRQTLVQELFGIEALACTDVLCMDKTGTLTQGNMEVSEIISLSSMGLSSHMKNMMGMLVWSLEDENDVLLALKRYFPEDDAEPCIKRVPFSSERAWSGAQFKAFGTVVMGAPDKLLHDIPESIKNKQMKGTHVIAFAHTRELLGEELPDVLTPIAAVCLRDAIRPEAAEVLRYFKKQGIRLMIFSGDSADAAASVAQLVGMEGAETAIDAAFLATDLQVQEALSLCSVFGRVSPEQKRQFVQTLQQDGHTVAMLGDGVNDVLAIRQADCGIAMASGCDASRRVARLVLMDNHFSALPKIVSEGRRVVNNIGRVAEFFLTKTCFSFLLSLICALTQTRYPFEPLQLSIYSMICEALPALILTLRPNAAQIQKKILLQAVKRALPFAFAITVGALVIPLLAPRIGLTQAAVSWAVFAWTLLVGLGLVLKVVFARRIKDASDSAAHIH